MCVTPWQTSFFYKINAHEKYEKKNNYRSSYYLYFIIIQVYNNKFPIILMINLLGTIDSFSF